MPLVIDTPDETSKYLTGWAAFFLCLGYAGVEVILNLAGNHEQ